MTTVNDFAEYTDIDGSLMVGVAPVANIQFDCKWKRTVNKVPMAQGYAEKQIPGYLELTVKIKKGALIHSDAEVLQGYSLTDTPITGTASTLQAAATFTADTVETIGANPATPSRVRISLTVADITTAGEVIVYGTDAADNKISELFVIPVSTTAGTNFDGSKVFKTTTKAAIIGLASTGGGKLTFASLAGASSITVGNPKVFDIVGTVTKGAKSIQITIPDCWFINGGLTWTEGGKPIPVEVDVAVYDPSALSEDIVG